MPEVQTHARQFNTDDRATAPLGQPLAPLIARKQGPGEWWYYNGHLSSQGRRYSVHIAFFRFASDGFKIARIIPLTLLGNNVAFAHCSVTDHQTGTVYFSQRRGFRNHEASNAFLDVRIDDWSIDAIDHMHRVQTKSPNFELALSFRPLKPLVIHARGWEPWDHDHSSVHCSISRMQVVGDLRTDDSCEQVSGMGWMDREFGNIGPNRSVQGWDWMSIQLSDGHDLMLYSVIQRDGTRCLRATQVDEDGNSCPLHPGTISLKATQFWTSRVTSIKYPVAWFIRTEDGTINLRLELELDANEFDTRGSTATFYAESPAKVTGTHRGVAVTGQAFLESVGEHPGLIGCFDHPRQNMPLLGYVVNEARCRFRSWTDQVSRLCR